MAAQSDVHLSWRGENDAVGSCSPTVFLSSTKRAFSLFGMLFIVKNVIAENEAFQNVCESEVFIITNRVCKEAVSFNINEKCNGVSENGCEVLFVRDDIIYKCTRISGF